MTAAMYSVLLLVTVLVLQPIAGLSEEKPVDSVMEPQELPEQWREFDNEHADLDYGSTDMKPDSKKKKYPVKPPAMSQEVNKDGMCNFHLRQCLSMVVNNNDISRPEFRIN
ncbi:uncharacterized protein LOC121385098 [Gigantopelta aegis]|uniref:uncharacterized protein LOC121385098 n=1 Tax=Gigantopelta aegis TaxID=1735272 RepID=UPI001B88A925|nr:uncharacterized protein LOC121385098 [Gigantopelta aegis]